MTAHEMYGKDSREEVVLFLNSFTDSLLILRNRNIHNLYIEGIDSDTHLLTYKTWLLASTTGMTWLQQTPQKSLGLAHYFDKLSNL